jgi:chemotaxis protein MotC
MKLPKFSLPKFSLPKISAPKISLPKLSAPKFSLPKFSRKKKRPADDEVAEQTPEDDGGEAPRKGLNRFIPRLKGKARIIVPVAAGLLLVGGGVGGYYVWRIMQAPSQGETQAAAPESGAAEKGGVQKAENEAAKPEATAPPHGGEAHNEGAKEAAKEAAKEPGKEEAGGHEKAPEGGGGGHEGGGHEGGAGGKQKVVIAPLPPPPPPGEIETMVRRLQDLQEKVSAGDSEAFKEMPKHLRRLGRAIFEAPPETWEKKENTRALIVYLLSGGNPAAGRKALASKKFLASDAPVTKAAVAYLENVEGPDRDVMLTLDPLTLDPSLGASVAFVQSVLLTPRDRDGALAKLDIARLLAPGGLVEEAALRREVGLLAEARQYEKFASLGRQYWARFRASPYAENFLRQFMLGVARVAVSIKLSEWSQLNGFVESLTPETKRNIYLTVAQNASVVGNVDLARMAAQRARDLSPEESQERQRAIVYGALAAVGEADPVSSARLLDGVDRAKLPAGDQPLHDAAAYVSGRIYRPPAKGFKETPPGDANAVDADLERAEKLLAQGDAAIASARKTMARQR